MANDIKDKTQRNDLSNAPGNDFGDTQGTELEDFFSGLSGIKVHNISGPALLRQEISSPFQIVYEKFDHEHKKGIFQVFDNRKCETSTIDARTYKRLIERPLHSHSYLEIMIVLSGTVLNQVENESFVYREGQGCVMSPNINHGEIPEGDAEILFVEISIELLKELLDTMKQEGQKFKGSSLTEFLRDISEESGNNVFRKYYLDFSPCTVSDVLHPSINLLRSVALPGIRDNTPGCTYLIRAAILHFFADLGDVSRYTLQQVSSSLDHKEFLVSKTDLLLKSTHGRIKKGELEELLSYSGDYLNRIYKQVKGVSISDACKQIMVSDACRLLKNTNHSVDSIIQELGITSRGFFFSEFLRQTGMTPKEYRR